MTFTLVFLETYLSSGAIHRPLAASLEFPVCSTRKFWALAQHYCLLCEYITAPFAAFGAKVKRRMFQK